MSVPQLSGQPSRRILFHGLGALGVAVALAGCGAGGGSTAAQAPSSPTTGAELAKTADIPVGGGVVLADQQIVITQPTSGEFKAFTAVCTHAGNIVTSVADGEILCAYHGSAYSAATGQVEGGPAPSPLAEVPIRVSGDAVVAA